MRASSEIGASNAPPATLVAANNARLVAAVRINKPAPLA